jgi:rod shape-determining protein MreB
MCMGKSIVRYGVITALAGGAAVLIAGPDRVGAILHQTREKINTTIDANIKDPVALRAQLRSLEKEYPERIGEVRGDLAELREQKSQLERDLEVSRRVVALADADLSQLQPLLAKAEAHATQVIGVSTSPSVPVVRVVFGHESLSMDEAYAKAQRMQQVRGAYASRAGDIERDLGYIGQQEGRLGELLTQLETEHASFPRSASTWGSTWARATRSCAVRGQGIVLNEPSVVAVRKGTNQVLKNGEAVGWVAKEMLGKTPGSITADPSAEGRRDLDFEITEAMLSYFIRKVNGRKQDLRAARGDLDPVGHHRGREAGGVRFRRARRGAPDLLIEEPMAAAIGAGLPFAEATASMIVDIGGGTTEVAIMSLADIATCESVRVAGDDMDEAIINHMKRTYNMMIGEQTAERIKIEIGSAAPMGPELSMEVRGRDMISGSRARPWSPARRSARPCRSRCTAIIEAVTRTLERAEPELAADLVENGITMAGGGSLLRGLPNVVQKATGLPTKLADDPLTCVARGTCIYLEHIEEWKDTLENEEV